MSLVAAAIIGGTATVVARSRRCNQERRIVRYLQANTEDRPGKQYLSIKSVAQGIGIDANKTTKAVDRSPIIFRRKKDENMIGLYEEERSVYEERGIITL